MDIRDSFLHGKPRGNCRGVQIHGGSADSVFLLTSETHCRLQHFVVNQCVHHFVSEGTKVCTWTSEGFSIRIIFPFSGFACKGGPLLNQVIFGERTPQYESQTFLPEIVHAFQVAVMLYCLRLCELAQTFRSVLADSLLRANESEFFSLSLADPLNECQILRWRCSFFTLYGLPCVCRLHEAIAENIL
ncbi:hypothetical protein DU484_13975 [Haloplanus rubicundus]|uniref:Uncharacterized protein n=1 Tax=Haloplanus rubicundus TaxID=1547898 RepID=A0A345EF91_9EURY|nr:hypothetical protein DU484_13975 [Haloplanus rubicundus]